MKTLEEKGRAAWEAAWVARSSSSVDPPNSKFVAYQGGTINPATILSDKITPLSQSSAAPILQAQIALRRACETLERFMRDTTTPNRLACVNNVQFALDDARRALGLLTRPTTPVVPEETLTVMSDSTLSPFAKRALAAHMHDLTEMLRKKP